jgi:hypothetical protein
MKDEEEGCALMNEMPLDDGSDSRRKKRKFDFEKSILNLSS